MSQPTRRLIPEPSRQHRADPPTWTRPREVLPVVAHPSHLRRSLATAAIVGTVLFSINQLDVVLIEGWTLRVVIKAALTYLVPFCVANIGILSASKRTESRPARHTGQETPEAPS